MDTHTADALTAVLQETWDAPVGESATATVGDWTAEIYGHARQQGWPQPMDATIRLHHRDGDMRIRGARSVDLQSWDDLTALWIDLDAERVTIESQESLASLGREYREAQARLDRATSELKSALRTAYSVSHRTAEPLTKYRLAQASGIPEPTVGRWLR